VFDVIGKRNWFFLFSGLIVVPGLIFILLTPATNGKVGLQFSVDYTGGTVWQIQFVNKNVSLDEVRKDLVANGVTDADVSQDTANYITIRSKQPDLITAPPTINPSVSASAVAASASAAGASASAAAASAGASATASSAAASASASAAAASASAAAAPTGTPLSPSASAAAASQSAAAASQSAAVASASASAGTVAASQSAAVASAAAAAAAATPTPYPTQKANSVGQDGKACGKYLPQSGILGKVATAFEADPKLGPISCTGQQSVVGPIVSQQLITQAIILILIGSLGILIWIGVRFNSIKFGATALAALVHDVIVVVGLFAIFGTLFGVQIDALFVTAMLTVIGFSVHDTIVVYDRIRENRARHAGEPFDRIVNHSILQTFGRSINTSLTVVVTLTALLLFAGASIHYFVLALLIGIISGTYSSIFNASPLLVVWQLYDDRKRAERLAAMRGGRRS
jgi:preprotein translocase SecF subunit